jgi:hypothetical protein
MEERQYVSTKSKVVWKRGGISTQNCRWTGRKMVFLNKIVGEMEERR